MTIENRERREHPVRTVAILAQSLIDGAVLAYLRDFGWHDDRLGNGSLSTTEMGEIYDDYEGFLRDSRTIQSGRGIISPLFALCDQERDRDGNYLPGGFDYHVFSIETLVSDELTFDNPDARLRDIMQCPVKLISIAIPNQDPHVMVKVQPDAPLEMYSVRQFNEELHRIGFRDNSVYSDSERLRVFKAVGSDGMVMGEEESRMVMYMLRDVTTVNISLK